MSLDLRVRHSKTTPVPLVGTKVVVFLHSANSCLGLLSSPLILSTAFHSDRSLTMTKHWCTWATLAHVTVVFSSKLACVTNRRCRHGKVETTLITSLVRMTAAATSTTVPASNSANLNLTLPAGSDTANLNLSGGSSPSNYPEKNVPIDADREAVITILTDRQVEYVGMKGLIGNAYNDTKQRGPSEIIHDRYVFERQTTLHGAFAM